MNLTRRCFLAIAALFPFVSIQPPIEGADMLWGTYGLGGLGPLRWVKLIDCTTDHLQSILRTQLHVWHNPAYFKPICAILKSRGAEIPEYTGWTKADMDRMMEARRQTPT